MQQDKQQKGFTGKCYSKSIFELSCSHFTEIMWYVHSTSKMIAEILSWILEQRVLLMMDKLGDTYLLTTQLKWVFNLKSNHFY